MVITLNSETAGVTYSFFGSLAWWMASIAFSRFKSRPEPGSVSFRMLWNKGNPTRSLSWSLKGIIVLSTCLVIPPTSRMSLIRVILWKGRTRNDLRLCLWQTGSLSSFFTAKWKCRFCCLNKKRQGAIECTEWNIGVEEHQKNSQQLVDQGLLVHHVCHIRNIEALKLRAVLKHNVFERRY